MCTYWEGTSDLYRVTAHSIVYPVLADVAYTSLPRDARLGENLTGGCDDHAEVA